MGVLDQIMDKQSLEAEDIVKHLHKLMTEGRIHLMDIELSKLMNISENLANLNFERFFK